MAEGQMTDAGPVERPQFAWSSQAALDVVAERRRQIEAEGWTPEHDDEHVNGEMALAAACYAVVGLTDATPTEVPAWWPRQWDASWWRPRDNRRNLVRAAALLLAEIERLDRGMTPNAEVTEPDVAKRLRLYEGAVMGQRSKADGTRPINPCITAREAIQLADWIKHLRERNDGRSALPAPGG